MNLDDGFHNEAGQPRVQYLICGGTIFSEMTPEGMKPVASGEDLLKRYLPDLSRLTAVRTREIMRLDSTDMHYEEYLKVAQEMCQSAREGYVPVDAQGTDSMGYVAAFLSVRIFPKSVPYVVTGSMYPIEAENSDALPNLNAATVIARKGRIFPGTYVSINNGEIHRASRIVKVKPNRLKERNGVVSVVPEKRSFVNVNYPLLGKVRNNKFLYSRRGGFAQRKFTARQRERLERFRPLLEEFGDPLLVPHYEKVAVIDLYPNFHPEMLDEYYDKDYRVAVIKAPGTGGVPSNPRQMALVPRMKKWANDGRLIVVAPKLTYAIIDQEYEVNRRSADAGAVLTHDMHSEFAIAKAEMAAALAENPDEFKKIMLYNFEDEINENLIPERERVTDDEIHDILRKALKRPVRVRNGRGLVRELYGIWASAIADTLGAFRKPEEGS